MPGQQDRVFSTKGKKSENMIFSSWKNKIVHFKMLHAAAAAAAKSLQSCPTLCDPTRLPRPWDSPGKNTGVGCHCLLRKCYMVWYKRNSVDICTQCGGVCRGQKDRHRVGHPSSTWTPAQKTWCRGYPTCCSGRRMPGHNLCDDHGSGHHRSPGCNYTPSFTDHHHESPNAAAPQAHRSTSLGKPQQLCLLFRY